MITDAKVIYYIGTAIRANGDLHIKFRYSSEILERIGGCPALSRYIYQQNLASTLLRLGFERKRRSKGMGWFVIEKEVGEMNTDAIVSPSEWEDDQN